MQRSKSRQSRARWNLVLVALIATGLSACGAADGTGDDTNAQGDGQRVPPGNTLIAAQVAPHPPAPVEPALTPIVNGKMPPGFTNEQIVGLVRAGEECPFENKDWQRMEAFERPGLARRDGTHFCGYRWRHVGTVPDPMTAPKYCPKNHGCCNGQVSCNSSGAPGYTWLEPDDGGVYVSALPAEATQIIAGAIRQQHRAAIGSPASFPRGKNYFTDLPRKIKVYVLDNSDDDEPGVHGDTVASWIKQTACPDGDCGLWIHKRKVIDDDGKGDVMQLADTIMAAVDDAAGWPALINLSLQVHPRRVFEEQRLPGGEVSNHMMRFAHQSLETALNYARCHGVVVIAAAGNRDGGSDPFAGWGEWGENVAYPGAFGSKVSSPWACRGETALSGSLVVDAGAIHADGSDGSSTRERGQACLVAPSVALTPDGEPMEGTSFSAATLTGALAGVWRYAPFASGPEALAMLVKGAEKIPRGAGSNGCGGFHYATGVGFYDARRINLCKGMQEALIQTDKEARANPARAIYKFAGDMVTQLNCSPISVDAIAKVYDQDAVLERTARDIALERNFVSGLSSVPQAGMCGGALFADSEHRNDQSCPDQVMDNGTIAAMGPGTSPGSIGCGGCTLALLSNGSLWLYGSLLGTQVGSPTLNLGLTGAIGFLAQPTLLTTAAVERTYELGNVLNERDPGEPFAIQIAEGVSPGQLVEAAFSWESNNDGVRTAHVTGIPAVQANSPQ